MGVGAAPSPCSARCQTAPSHRTGGFTIGNIFAKEIAEHIVKLHNDSLEF